MDSWSHAERTRRGVSGLILLVLVPVALRLVQEVSVSWTTARMLAHTPTLAAGVAMVLLAQQHPGGERGWLRVAGRMVVALGVGLVVVLNRSMMDQFSDVLMYTAAGFGPPLSLSFDGLVAIAPLVVAGLGMTLQALVGEPATARRLRRTLLWGIPLVLGATSWMGAWWWPDSASGLAFPTVFTAVALATFWPRSPPVTSSSSAMVVDGLHVSLTDSTGGDRGFCRVLGRAGWGIVSIHVARTVAALGAPDALVALLWAAGCLVLAEAVASYLPQWLVVTRVELSPARAVVTRRCCFWTSVQEVPADRLVLRVREDARGSVLEVSDGEYVAIDALAVEIDASLTALRVHLAEQSAADAAVDRREPPSQRTLPRRGSPEGGDARPRLARLLEPQRLWHARLSLVAPAALTWLSGYLVATTPRTASCMVLAVSVLALGVAMHRLHAFRQRAELRRLTL